MVAGTATDETNSLNVVLEVLELGNGMGEVRCRWVGRSSGIGRTVGESGLCYCSVDIGVVRSLTDLPYSLTDLPYSLTDLPYSLTDFPYSLTDLHDVV